MLKIAAVCVLLLLPVVATVGQSQTGEMLDENLIHRVMDAFMAAWNQHDAHAFAAVFATDADFINWRGVGASGRANIEAFHAPVFATIFKASHQKYTDIKIRFVRADVAAVDVHWELTGALDAQGNPRPDRNGLLIFVMEKTNGQWQIAVMHNLDISALPPAPPPAK